MNERGAVLLQIVAIFWDLKKWAYQNNGQVIIINQPQSDFGKDADEIINPFGDKSQFAAKEIWKTAYTDRKPDRTRTTLSAFRSRSMGNGKLIANLTITENKIDILIR